MQTPPEHHRAGHTLRLIARLSLSAIFPAPALHAQTLFDWNGGTGNWSPGTNWSTGTVPNSAVADVFIDHGSAGNSAVTLLNGSAIAGRLTIDAGDSLTFSNTSSPAQQFLLTMVQRDFPASGTILNNGTMTIAGSSGTLLLRVGDDTTAQSLTINGSGVLVMGDATTCQIVGVSVSKTLINNSNIQGGGVIDSLTIQNTGVITATSTIRPLTINADSGSRNMGVLRAAAGATLIVNPVGGSASDPDGGLANTGGVIDADGAGAVVELVSNHISGGTLSTHNGGVMLLKDNSLFLDGSTHPITIAAGSNVRIPNGYGPDGKGTLIIDGTLTFDSTGSAARLQVANDIGSGVASMTLNGTGSVFMTSQTVNQINGTAGSALTMNIPLTGGGNIGGNVLNITNNSLITASGPAALTLDPLATFTNNDTGRAVASSTLTLVTGVFINSGGVFRAEGAGAVVNVSTAEIQGGLLTSTDGGEVRISAGALVNGTGSPVTITGEARIPNNAFPAFKGTVIADGNLRVDSTGGATSILIPNGESLTLNGRGTVTLANNANSQITGAGATLTNNMLIQGAGKIGLGALTPFSITNGGTINANETLGLIIDPQGTFVNNPGGIVRSTAGGGLIFNGGAAYTNNGLIEADGGNIGSAATGVTFTNYNATTDTLTGGTWRVNGPHSMVLGGVGPVVVNAADIELSGTGSTFSAINSLANNQGTLTLRNERNFTTPAALTNSGTLHVDGTAVLSTTGNLTLSGDSAVLEFDLPVLPAGTAYDAVDVNGTAALDGELRLAVSYSLASTLTASDSFTLLTANFPITGAFDNVASGSRVADFNGQGSFMVHYGPGSPFGASNLVVNNFIPAPVIVSHTEMPGTGEHAGQKEMDIVIKGAPGVTYVLEASTDLLDWNPLQSGIAAPATGLLAYEIFVAEATPRYFLRARSP